jgi:hypothetical protein
MPPKKSSERYAAPALDKGLDILELNPGSTRLNNATYSAHSTAARLISRGLTGNSGGIASGRGLPSPLSGHLKMPWKPR